MKLAAAVAASSSLKYQSGVLPRWRQGVFSGTIGEKIDRKAPFTFLQTQTVVCRPVQPAVVAKCDLAGVALAHAEGPSKLHAKRPGVHLDDHQPPLVMYHLLQGTG